MSTKGAPLLWAVKESFVAYVEALPDGAVTTADGAWRDADGRFGFPAAGSREGEQCYRGTIGFSGHGGVLRFDLADPALEIGVDGTVVTVATGPAAERVRFAVVRGDDVVATADGADLLGGVYSPGVALAPLSRGLTPFESTPAMA